MTETASNGRYRIDSVLGRGGFGTVYRSRFEGDGGFSKEVAIKVLDPDAFPGADVAQRLRDEARILGMLRHPSIVQVDRLVRLEGRWAVVMELVEGVDLARLGELVALPLGVVMQIGAEIAAALSAAWSTPGPSGRPLSLLHRDIKPSNVVVTGHGVVKVLDFGVAKAEFETREATSGQFIFGSEDYMAPERFEGVDGPAGDVYSLGVLLVQALTGRTMGRAPADPDAHAAAVDALLGPLAERLGPDLALVAELIAVFLAYDPADRPSAAECSDALLALADHARGPTLREWAAQEVAPLAAEIWAEASAAARDAQLADTVLTEDDPELEPSAIHAAGSVSAALPSEVWPDAPPDEPTADDTLLPSEQGAAGLSASDPGAAADDDDDEDVHDDPSNPPNLLAAALGMVDEPLDDLSDEIVWDERTLSQTANTEPATVTAPDRSAALAAARTSPLVAPRSGLPKRLPLIIGTVAAGLLVFVGLVAVLTASGPEVVSPQGAEMADLPVAPGIGDLVDGVEVEGALEAASATGGGVGMTPREAAAQSTTARGTSAALSTGAARITPTAAPTTVQVTGDADKVFLVSDSAAYALPGPVPPGTWRIEARFAGHPRSSYGTILLTEGAPATIACDGSSRTCTMR